MTLTSFFFLVLVLAGLIVYYIVPKVCQWIVLLAMSLVFYYFAGTPYTFMFVCISAFTAYISPFLFNKVHEKNKKWILIGLLITNIGMWFVLKAQALWVPIVQLVFPSFNNDIIGIVASLGMGFYTMQVMGYIVDCYWGNIEPQKNPLKVLLFTSFFPQMITGPISTYSQLCHIFDKHPFSYERVTAGAQRVLWGFFKKIVMADKLAVIPSTITESIFYYNGFYTWIAVLVYPLQLYLDFSGCTDIAIGVAEMFDITLPENFNNPFFSKNSQEFWQRWHMTLGTWAKTYVFYPFLASGLMVKIGKNAKKRFGKKVGKLIHTSIGMLVLWFVMGIWHGSIQHMVGVSMFYWLVITANEILSPVFVKVNEKLEIKKDSTSWHLFQSMRTYGLYSISCTFFSYGVSFALFLLSQCANVILKHRENPWIFFDGSLANFVSFEEMNIIIIGILILIVVAILREKYGYARNWMRHQCVFFRWFIWIGLFVVVLIYGNYGPGYDASIFIYQGF